MYNINEVSQVNEKYIFFSVNNAREVVNVNDLQDLYATVCNNINHYNFMMEECKKVSEKYSIEYEKIEKLILNYEKVITDNQNDQMIKRGLHDVCFSLENSKQNQKNLVYEIAGVNSIITHSLKELDRLNSLKNQVKRVIEKINFKK